MISIHVYVLFGLIMILGIFEYWFARMMLIKEFEKSQNKLLDDIRGLCNELLEIKNKGTIVITSLSMSKGKGPNRVVVTTIPKGEWNKKKSNGKQVTNLEIDKVVLVAPANVPKGCKFKKVYRKKKE